MPTCGTWKVPFRGKFGAYTEGRRVVPPFSIQSLQKGTVVDAPQKIHATKERPTGITTFRRYEIVTRKISEKNTIVFVIICVGGLNYSLRMSN